MNKPEYILVDEIGAAVEATRIKLGLTVLNYQYGYVRELNETLNDWAKTPEHKSKRYPLVWLQQPFTISHEQYGWWGELQNGRIMIIKDTLPDTKAYKRMTEVFKAILYPIYRELLQQIERSEAFDTKGANQIQHSQTDRYYFGEEQKSFLSQPVDVLEISNLVLKVNNNLNCGTAFQGT